MHYINSQIWEIKDILKLSLVTSSRIVKLKVNTSSTLNRQSK